MSTEILDACTNESEKQDDEGGGTHVYTQLFELREELTTKSHECIRLKNLIGIWAAIVPDGELLLKQMEECLVR